MGNDDFWKENFGKEYHARQKQNEVGSVVSNTAFFANILSKTKGVKEVIEFGAGSGQNISALNSLGITETIAVEINEEATTHISNGDIFRGSVFDYDPEWGKGDLVFTKGLAIHISPEDIEKLYHKLFECSKKYILMAEYYSPNRVEIDYRGHSGKLWKANFYEEMMSLYPELELVDSGFVGPWDQFPQDSINWWLWRKV